MRTNAIEAVMGSIVVIIAGFFLIFAYTSSKGNVIGGYTLMAKFDRIDGISAGADVKISGVKVGSIGKLSIDPQSYQAKVELSISKDILIPDDSMAEVVSESFMGSKYIALIPGGSATMLQPGQEILYTQSSISFENLIGKFLFNKN